MRTGCYALTRETYPFSRNKEVIYGSIFTERFIRENSSPDVKQVAIDANSVQVTIHHQGVTVSGTLHVNAQGQLTRLRAQRYREEQKHYRLDSWTAESSDYQEVEGMRIPTRSEVAWHLASGDFSWFKFKITEIEDDQSGKRTVLS